MLLVLQWLLRGLPASASNSGIRFRGCCRYQTSVAACNVLRLGHARVGPQLKNKSSRLGSRHQPGVAKALQRLPRRGDDHTALSEVVFRARLKRLSPAFEWLYYEADVTSQTPGMKRLVDHVDYKQNPRLWSRLLQFRRRIHGIEGVIAIWNGLYKRKIVLPVNGPEADTLWRGFVDAALCSDQMLDELLDYSETLVKKHGRAWACFYEIIVGHFLRRDVSRTYNVHKRLKDWFPHPQGYLARIVRSWPSTTESLYVLERIYLDSSVRDLYPVIVPLLCHRGRYYDAYRWHRFLLQNGDVPSTIGPAQPLLNHLTLWGYPAQLEGVTESLRNAGVHFSGSVEKENKPDAVFLLEDMNKMFGKVFSLSEKPFNDKFWARLFATKAFSVDVLMNFLRFFEITEIGPLCLRELAVREANPDSILRRIAQMSEAGISIGSSKFSRLVRQLASDKETELLEDLLASDQHPDVLEDENLQEALLASYLEANDMRQVRKTLAILTAFKKDPKTLEYNLILRVHLRKRNKFAVEHVLHDMGDTNVTLTSKSSRSMMRYLLRTRNKGKNPVAVPQMQDDLGLTVRNLLGNLHSGGTLAPDIWGEVFRRLGMAGRLDELEKLALWLAYLYDSPLRAGAKHRYAPSRVGVASSWNTAAPAYIPEEVPSHHPAHPLRKIFSVSLQKSIIAWGFISASKNPNEIDAHPSDLAHKELDSDVQPWTRGLRLLRKLAERGVFVQKTPVRQAFLQRLTILYGPGRSSRRRNRRLRQYNSIPMQTMIRQAEKVWGFPLLNGKDLWWYRLRPSEKRARHGDLKDSVILDQGHVDAGDHLRVTKDPPSAASG